VIAFQKSVGRRYHELAGLRETHRFQNPTRNLVNRTAIDRRPRVYGPPTVDAAIRSCHHKTGRVWELDPSRPPVTSPVVSLGATHGTRAAAARADGPLIDHWARATIPLRAA
jgi:hypothetical protein